MKRTLAAFSDKVLIGYDDGCWRWQASTIEGYGKFKADGYHLAHRWAYAEFVGAIPPTLQLDHLCRNRACVNPLHLEPVTNRENSLRGVGASAVHARATHCPQGHRYDEANTVMNRNQGRLPSRRCRICKAASNRRYKLKKERAK